MFSGLGWVSEVGEQSEGVSGRLRFGMCRGNIRMTICMVVYTKLGARI